MNGDEPCPEPERWIELLAGRLDATEAERLRRHLEGCPSCAATARDARQFLVAMGELPDSSVARPARPLLVAAAAAVALIGTVVVLKTTGERKPALDPVAELAAALEVAAPPVTETGSVESELVFRGEGDSERASSLEAALAPYRKRDFARACAALDLHARHFSGDREARYLGAVACLKGGAVDRAEGMLAALAASPGDRRDDARGLLERLRQARASS
jgi:hypothetical protein